MTGKSRKNADRASPLNIAAKGEPESSEREHRLAGLEPDNFLAFLALLGLLRALDMARPGWKARSYWNVAEHPLRPVLTLREPATAAELVAAAASGTEQWGQALAPLFDRANVAKDRERLTEITPDIESLRALHADLSAAEARWLASLAGAAVEVNKAGRFIGLQSSCGPLKFTSGKMAYAGAIYGLIAPPQPSDHAQRIRKTLFNGWSYSDAGDTLRYAPSEARRYALQGADPTKDTIYRKKGAHTERGASILAAVGLLSMPAVTTGFCCQVPGFRPKVPGAFVWPIWEAAARLASIEALLAHPALHHQLFALPPKIAFLMVAERTRVTDQGDYYNVTPATIEHF